MSSFTGRHAVVTGGSSGIGLATARALAERGARLTLLARRPGPLDDAVADLAEHGADAAAVPVDVADRDAVRAVMAGVASERGPVDVLVTSAGVARPGYFEELGDDVFREMMEVDYFGTLWPIRAVVPSMVERGTGSIVGISSGAGLVGVFGYTAYGAAKFAVRGLLEALRAEMAPHGVHVACCFPPDVDTPQLAAEEPYKPAETRALSGTFAPLQPERVAECVVAGIEARRFLLVPDLGSRLLAVGAGAAPRAGERGHGRHGAAGPPLAGPRPAVTPTPDPPRPGHDPARGRWPGATDDTGSAAMPAERPRPAFEPLFEHEATLGATMPLGPPIEAEPARPPWWRILWRLLFLLLSAAALYVLLPQLLDVWDQIPKLGDLNRIWFAAVILLEAGSFACQWKLTRTALPMVSWFVAGTAQLVSNAVSKIVPGGAAVGAATGYRMLSVSGVNRGTAGAALAATAIVSNGVLFALPMVAVIGSILSAPVPSDLAVIAWGGALLFLLLFGVVFVLVRFDRPLWMVGRLVERISRWLGAHLHRSGGATAVGMVHQRDVMVDALGSRWETALAAAVGNWGLDYLALVAALYAVGATPRLSLILLAYGAAAVLSMIPITPGGLGFVEAGLAATLTAAGVSGPDALLATLAYRFVSYWLPLPAGLVASILFRRRYGRIEAEPDEGPGPHPQPA